MKNEISQSQENTQYMVLFIKKYPRDKSIHKAGQWLSRTGELGELGELEAVTKR